VRKARPKPSGGQAKTIAKHRDQPEPAGRPRSDFWICLVLLATSFAVYAPVRHFDFVNFDDPEFVRDNPHLRGGLTAESVAWAFTSGESANWFPVTRLSHVLDAQFWGRRSGPQHLTSVLFHALAVLCLFAFLRRASGERWPSALVALLFALHPLHVESVAWVAERKDVLCAFFWFLALWAYARYAERPGAGRYLLVLFPFCLGLMAKPMIVTLPFVLLLLDVWPLRRRPGLWEKVPFLALSAGGALATYVVQQRSGAVGALAAYPFGLRVENALVSYVVYIGKMFWPSRLAVFYPYPRDIPAWQTALAAVALAGISILVLRCFRIYPYLAVGWLWYLATLAPVIGLVQAGEQARADRYMYVPMAGLAIMLAWGAADLLRHVPRGRVAAGVLAGAACLACAVVAEAQVQHWRDSESLFRHALAVTEGNYVAHENLGIALAQMPGRLPEAIGHYRAALRIRPNYADAHSNLGCALAQMPGRLADAIQEFTTALAEKPDFAEAHFNLANALAQVPGRQPEAIGQYQAALRIRPDYLSAHLNLGTALLRTPGRLRDAITEYQAAVRLDPHSAEAHNNLGSALAQIPARLANAITEYRAALQEVPNFAKAHNNLGSALAQIPGHTQEAIGEYQAAVRADPAYAEAHYNLAVTLAEAGRMPEAIGEYEAALRANPTYAEAHYNLGVALLKVDGRFPEALSHLEAALRINPDPNLRRVVDQLRASTASRDH
jgi:tetratricopeptide (TPR) repeat protein